MMTRSGMEWSESMMVARGRGSAKQWCILSANHNEVVVTEPHRGWIITYSTQVRQESIHSHDSTLPGVEIFYLGPHLR